MVKTVYIYYASVICVTDLVKTNMMISMFHRANTRYSSCA